MERSEESIIVVATVPLLLNKLRNLLEYKEIAYSRSKVQVQVEDAMSELERISRKLGDAEKIQTDRLDLIDPFMIEFLLNHIEKVIDCFIGKTELRRRCCYINIPLLNRLSSQLDQIRLSQSLNSFRFLFTCTAEEIMGTTGAISCHPAQRTRPTRDLAPDDSDFVGLEDKVDELVKVLCYTMTTNSIAVTGEPGSGKTEMTKTVYNATEVKRRFHGRAWVNFSENFEHREFLVNILTQLTWDWPDWLDENLPTNELRSKLLNFIREKRCLIVVDDVRTLEDLHKLSNNFDFSSWSWLILTTCNRDVAQAIDWRSPICLRRLTNEESWTLFLKKARILDDLIGSVSTDLQENILSKCDGSPRLILILEGLLSTREVRKWPFVIQDVTARPVLNLGYQDLSSRMKFCFLYFGLFPRAFEIPVRRLIHLWVAEGLVIPLREENMAPQDLAEEYLTQLIRRHMIEVTKVRLDGSPKTCRMPNTIWDVFSPIAVDLGLFHIHKDTTYTSTGQFPKSNIRRLKDYGGISSNDSSLQNLRSYVSFNTEIRESSTKDMCMFLDAFVTRSRGFGLLVVLDLENVYRPMLSETLGRLLHLKYLGLRRTFLDSLPMSVGNLPYLETLDVKHTDITTLPSSIWKAKKLQHLYLNENPFDMSFKTPNIRSVTVKNILQTLSGLFIGNESVVKSHLNKLDSLRKLKLTFHSKSGWAIARWISEFTSLQSLKLRSIDEFGRPSNLELRALASHQELLDLYLLGRLPITIDEHTLPKNLKILTLSASKLEQDPMPILGNLSHLNCLRLFRNSYAGEHMECLAGGFPELRVLKLWMLEDLEEWNVEEGAMPHLRELEIRSCNKLKQPKGFQLMSNLKEVILTNMSGEFVANAKEVLLNAFVKDIKLPFATLRE